MTNPTDPNANAAETRRATLLAAAHAGRAVDAAREMRARGEEVHAHEVADAMQASGDVFGAARFRIDNPLAFNRPAAPVAAPVAARNEHHAEYLRLKGENPFAAAEYAAAHPVDVYGGESK